MKVEQIYTGCLAEAAYYIESNGEVAIIDPLRDPKPYIEKAKRNGATIRYIFETHFHADFVSGHLDLAHQTGATIVFGPNATPSYPALIAKDGEQFVLGEIVIEAIHTPGHTMESTTYLLKDEEGKNHCIFTGDTLFIGDVGRPDLAAKSDLTKEQLAGYLYESLHSKLLVFDDDLIVYPGHGAGSACGKNMSKETIDTLGNQKKVNYALQPMTKDQFVEKVLDGILPPPSYFPQNVRMNKMGYDAYEKVLNKSNTPLSAAEFLELAEQHHALILDVRDAGSFADSFIPKSINIGLKGDFAPWVGALIEDINQPILLVAEEGFQEEAIERLSRVGYDHVLGYLKDGISTWQNTGYEVDRIESIKADAFASKISKIDFGTIIDVRKESEYTNGHVLGALNIPLAYLNELMNIVPKSGSLYVHCAGGYRSMIASSILKARGFHDIYNVEGGFNAIINTGTALSELSSCSTK